MASVRSTRYSRALRPKSYACLACELCGEQFCDEQTMREHIKMKHGCEQHICFKCDVGFKTAKLLQQHLCNVGSYKLPNAKKEQYADKARRINLISSYRTKKSIKKCHFPANGTTAATPVKTGQAKMTFLNALTNGCQNLTIPNKGQATVGLSFQNNLKREANASIGANRPLTLKDIDDWLEEAYHSTSKPSLPYYLHSIPNDCTLACIHESPQVKPVFRQIYRRLKLDYDAFTVNIQRVYGNQRLYRQLGLTWSTVSRYPQLMKKFLKVEALLKHRQQKSAKEQESLSTYFKTEEETVRNLSLCHSMQPQMDCKQEHKATSPR